MLLLMSSVVLQMIKITVISVISSLFPLSFFCSNDALSLNLNLFDRLTQNIKDDITITSSPSSPIWFCCTTVYLILTCSLACHKSFHLTNKNKERVSLTWWISFLMINGGAFWVETTKMSMTLTWLTGCKPDMAIGGWRSASQRFHVNIEVVLHELGLSVEVNSLGHVWSLVLLSRGLEAFSWTFLPRDWTRTGDPAVSPVEGTEI